MTSYSIAKRLYNSFAFRFNRLAAAARLLFHVRLNNVTFSIPVINTLGTANTRLGEDWFFKLIRSLNLPADTDFLDIGVNVGQSLLAFRSCYANRYWGFEPNPDCVFYLEQLIKINKLERIHILPVGLSSQNAVVKLYARTDHDSAATILAELKPGIFRQQDAKYVPVFSFESLQLDIHRISLIKIDVEGAELDVISGMAETIRKHQPVIICEILDYTSPESKDREQARASKLVDVLKAMGYRMYRILHENRTKLEFEEITSFKLRKWVPESFNLNDYLFLPAHRNTLPQ